MASHVLSRRGWAWEFLRRNRAYGEDWVRIAEEMAGQKVSGDPLRVRPDWQAAMAKWGMIFRG